MTILDHTSFNFLPIIAHRIHLRLRLLGLLVLALLATACTGLPKGVAPINNFDLPAYLGTWYEIARLDHSFERGLQKVSARYELQDDGSVKVTNSGYSETKQAWQTAEGKAYLVAEDNLGHLKVSFFGPFYSSYVIFELGEDYAFVSGNSTSYLWLLARQPSVSEETYQRFVDKATALGFDTNALIRVSQ